MNNNFNFLFVFLLITCIIFALLSNKKPLETFSNIVECSNCRLIPNNNQCIKLYDISYTPLLNNDQYIYDISDLKITDLSKIFCPWKENCSANTFFESSEERFNTKFNCCNNSSFYNTYTTSYSEISNNQIQKQLCSNLQTIITDLCNNDNNRFMKIANNQDYIKIKNICNQKDFSGIILDLSYTDTLNIIKDPTLSVNEIFNYQNQLSMKNDAQLQEENLSKDELNSLNAELNTLDINLTRDKNRKIEIQNEIVKFFKSNIISLTKYYNPVNKFGEQLSDDYLINTDQFFNCFGEVKNPNTDKLDICMNSLYAEKNRTSFFNVSSDAKYTTVQDVKNTPYPSYNDFKMELKKLNNLNNNNDINTNNNKNVVNSYLQYINSFYTNQLNNKNANDENQKQLRFINNELIISHPLKNYTAGSTNYNACIDSITGNKDFSYCGVAPYNY